MAADITGDIAKGDFHQVKLDSISQVHGMLQVLKKQD